MFLENQLLILRKIPFDFYGYYDQNGDRMFFKSFEDALIFEKKIMIDFFKKFK